MVVAPGVRFKSAMLMKLASLGMSWHSGSVASEEVGSQWVSGSVAFSGEDCGEGLNPELKPSVLLVSDGDKECVEGEGRKSRLRC